MIPRGPLILWATLALACSDDPTPPASNLDGGGSEAGAMDMLPAPDVGPDAAAPPRDATPDRGARDAGPDLGPPCDPAPERCDGADNDCDGEVDEGFAVGAPCGAGVGVCRALAVFLCDDEGEALCPAEAGAPGIETCDGRDEDCDGRVDEDFDGDGDGFPRCDGDPCAAPCPEGEEARCRLLCDVQDCRDEDLGVFPAAIDTCGDGIDQNCDGQDAPCTVAAGRVDALAVAAAAEPTCPDVNGDGAPDNAMALLGGVANAALQGAVDDRSINLFFAAVGLAPPGRDGAFELGVVTAAVAGEGYAVDPDALDMDGRARIRFPGARVRQGALRAGPGRFELALPVAGLALQLVLFEAQVLGDLSVDDDFGLTLAEGLVWGAVRAVDLEATLDGLEQACVEQDPEPEFCGPLRMFRPLIANVLRVDEDVDGDGELDAYSVCIQVGATPAPLEGLGD